MNPGEADNEVYQQVVQSIMLAGLNGVPNLKFRSAAELAKDYKLNKKYRDDHHRVREMIQWETSKNFSTGFISGVGGLLTLPVTVPGALAASWVIQARLAAAIADVYGHDLANERVQALTVLCILGDGAKEVAKRSGVQIGRELAEQAAGKISAEMIMQINKQVGFKLLAKAGETGFVNLAVMVPIAGAVVGGTVDAVSCRSVGETARLFFGKDSPSMETVDVDVIDKQPAKKKSGIRFPQP